MQGGVVVFYATNACTVVEILILLENILFNVLNPKSIKIQF